MKHKVDRPHVLALWMKYGKELMEDSHRQRLGLDDEEHLAIRRYTVHPYLRMPKTAAKTVDGALSSALAERQGLRRADP